MSTHDRSVMLTEPEQIAMVSFLSLKGRIQLKAIGVDFGPGPGGRTELQIARDTWGITARTYEQAAAQMVRLQEDIEAMRQEGGARHPALQRVIESRWGPDA